jgi:sugar phosphate isomerase/epimerase
MTPTQSPAASWTLWAGTVGLDSPITDRVRAATATGCNRISIGPLDLVREGGRSSARELGARIRDAGLQIVVDPIWNWYPSQDAMPTRFADFTVAETLDVAVELGAVAATALGQLRRHLGDPGNGAGQTDIWQPTTELLAEHFGQLCYRAADIGLAIHLEFMPMTDIQDLAMAWDIVNEAGHDNSAIVLDSWHFFRGRPDFDLLARLPGSRIGAVQLSDALPEVSGTLFQDVRRRLLPGDGSFDLVRLVRMLADIDGLASVGPEVINPELSGRPAVEAAQAACDRVRDVIAKALATDQANVSSP